MGRARETPDALLLLVLLLPLSTGVELGVLPLGLDEAVALVILMWGLLRRPQVAIEGIAVVLSVVISLSVLNGGLLFRPGLGLTQLVNIAAFFGSAHIALHRVDYEPSAILATLYRATTGVLLFGYMQLLIGILEPGIYVEIQSSFGLRSFALGGPTGPRFSSLFIEPSHFVQFAAFPYAVFWLMPDQAKRRPLLFAAVAAALVLTGSALAVPALAFPPLAILALRSRTGPKMMVLVLITGSLLVESRFGLIPSTARLKIDEFFVGLLGGGEIESLNASSRSLAHAGFVTVESIKATHGLGFGVGSYRHAFDLFTPVSDRDRLFNSVSGGSLLFRVAAEMGLPGVVALGAFVARRRPSSLQVAALGVLVVSFVRLGGYTTGILAIAALVYGREVLGERNRSDSHPLSVDEEFGPAGAAHVRQKT